MALFAHTYSIIARDPKSGQFGVGVQSRAFAVGALVPWAERGVGAVATQAYVDVSYGPLGLDLMRAGKSAKQTLAALLAADENRDVRQVALIDRSGEVAVFTGDRCIASAGHVVGKAFSVQGNLLASDTVTTAMSDAYQKSNRDFSERLLEALEAGQDAGGDVRGVQSAALIVVPGPDDPLERRMVTNLRVDDHDHPLIELRRLLTIQRGEEWAAQAEHAVEIGDMKAANDFYGMLRGLAVGPREPLFWYAVKLAEHGHADEALPMFAQVFAVEPLWVDLIDRLVKAKFFPSDKALIKKVKQLPRKK